MANYQFLSFNNLKVYDKFLKKYISDEDAHSIKTIRLNSDGKTIDFFKTENPNSNTHPDFTIKPDDVDLSNLIEKINNPIEDNIVLINYDGNLKDSGIAIKDIVSKSEIGDLSKLQTAEKSDVVSAVNEVKTSTDHLESEYKMILTKSTEDDNYAATYILVQGVGDKSVEIGRINILKDLVVKSGEIVKDPEGQIPGTYLSLIIQNQENPIYINVADLIDAYTAKQNATQIQISISDTNEISAVVIPNSISSIELSQDSITTEKIVDKNVTKEKLEQSVQDSLNKIDSFVEITDEEIESLFNSMPESELENSEEIL